MVDFVEQAHGVHSVDLGRETVPFGVEGFNADFRRPYHIAFDAGNREAAFLHQPECGPRAHHRIHVGHGAVCVAWHAHHRNPLVDADLRRGQADSLALVEGVERCEQVGDEPLQALVEYFHGRAGQVQGRVGVGDDLLRNHRSGLFSSRRPSRGRLTMITTTSRAISSEYTVR